MNEPRSTISTVQIDDIDKLYSDTTHGEWSAAADGEYGWKVIALDTKNELAHDLSEADALFIVATHNIWWAMRHLIAERDELQADLAEARIGAPFRAGDRVVFIDGKQVGTFERYKDQSHVVVRWNDMYRSVVVTTNGITLAPATPSASENGGDA